MNGPVLNDYDFGGYLIFRGIPTFIDGRTLFFGKQFALDYFDATALGAGNNWSSSPTRTRCHGPCCGPDQRRLCISTILRAGGGSTRTMSPSSTFAVEGGQVTAGEATGVHAARMYKLDPPAEGLYSAD